MDNLLRQKDVEVMTTMTVLNTTRPIQVTPGWDSMNTIRYIRGGFIPEDPVDPSTSEIIKEGN